MSAQEIETAAKELVEANLSNDWKAVTQAERKLQSAIDAQAAEIERLTTKNAELETEVEVLAGIRSADREHAAMYRWLRDTYSEVQHPQVFAVLVGGPMGDLDTAIRAAMKGGE